MGIVPGQQYVVAKALPGQDKGYRSICLAPGGTVVHKRWRICVIAKLELRHLRCQLAANAIVEKVEYRHTFTRVRVFPVLQHLAAGQIGKNPASLPRSRT